MIAIVNNCLRFEELAHEIKAKWSRPGYQDREGRFETLVKTYQVE